MGIPTQKYNGKNSYNNKVVVNYLDKTVKFKPVKGRMSSSSNYMAACYTAQIILGKILLIIFIFGLLGTIFLNGFELPANPRPLGQIALVYIGIYGVSPYVLALLFLIKRMRASIGRINAHLTVIQSVFVFKYNPIITGTVNPELFKGKRYIIPEFKNILLEYKLTGEYAKYIKNVKVVNKYVENPYLWEAHFDWTRRPRNGQFWIKYL